MKMLRKAFGKEAVKVTGVTIFYTLLVLALVIACGLSLFQGNWQSALLAVATIGLLFLPFVIEWKMNVYIPTLFSFVISFFLYATIILGGVADYYAKFWWWDVMLHSGSGLAFGIMGLILLLIFLRRGKVEASPLVLCFFAFCFALAIGLTWEIYEFASDELLGTNMQSLETGVVDTMKDEIMDTVGALIGATIGYFYLRTDISTPLDKTIDIAVKKNRRLWGRKK